MHHPTDRITHTTAFVTPVVEHWLEREIAQWVHPMKDRSDGPSHHERTLAMSGSETLRYNWSLTVASSTSRGDDGLQVIIDINTLRIELISRVAGYVFYYTQRDLSLFQHIVRCHLNIAVTFQPTVPFVLSSVDKHMGSVEYGF